jgi:hypothetical protein
MWDLWVAIKEGNNLTDSYYFNNPKDTFTFSKPFYTNTDKFLTGKSGGEIQEIT